MEIKRELLVGQLSSPSKAILPVIAAIGGVALPALIYLAFNANDPIAAHGWAIPSATDIAFSLAVLSLLGKRVPISLKIFLTAVAVIDDLIAILIIAIFYSSGISLVSLLVAAICLLVLIAINKSGVKILTPYLIVGIVMWLSVLQSGVHATIAGVLLGFCIPLRVKREGGSSMLEELEHALQPTVNYFILPVFAFANAGVSFAGMTLASLLHPVPMGITLGLFLGKQIGIFAACQIAFILKIARAPENTSNMQLYAISMIAGIGFTMSLFIGGLSFNTPEMHDYVRLGVLVGSILSGVVGYTLLRYTLRKH